VDRADATGDYHDTSKAPQPPLSCFAASYDTKIGNGSQEKMNHYVMIVEDTSRSLALLCSTL
jgi:hypothetical protein